MSEEELDKLNKDNYGFTMKEIDDDLGRYMIKYSDLLREKQQLISFLEDKIKNYEESIENSKPYLEHEELFQQVQNDIHTDTCIIVNLREVLDFVEKGGKNE